MIVFKFGGASVKDSKAFSNVVNIISNSSSEKIIVVVSAIGKTTNSLEKIVKNYFDNNLDEARVELEHIKSNHYKIATSLFPENQLSAILQKIDNLFVEIEWVIEDAPSRSFDFEYDQIVSIGELLSSTLISEYLKVCGLSNTWIDARDIIETDNSYRNAKVNWVKTSENFTHKKKIVNTSIIVTQGFIAGTSENFTTTLGREGSDFSASIFGYLSNSKSVTIWKDVEGVMNADPNKFSNTIKLDKMNYEEAIELSYYGVSIIHPKTIQPLKNKSIPLYIKCFNKPETNGTVISELNSFEENKIPCFIIKKNQVKLSLTPIDFSFIAEDHLQIIFACLSSLKLRANLIGISAITFKVCLDKSEESIEKIKSQLSAGYNIVVERNVELITIRNYNESTVNELTKGKKILLEQSNKITTRIITSSRA